jgi:SAM-dependent methyltransferase
MSDFTYVGSELELFSEVHNWKNYWSSRIRPFLKGDVAEVGAGLGANTAFLDKGTTTGRWVCLEPDARLSEQLGKAVRATGVKRDYEVRTATLQGLEPEEKFDTIVYIDVLEHIEDDAGELERAASRLKPGGRIIVLSPAHQWLFTPFDAAIGHFRRYNIGMLRSITPKILHMEEAFYLDSAGLSLSSGNRLFLKQAMPTKGQLKFWDTFVIPVSRVLDRLVLGTFGKTVVAVWQKKDLGT